MVISTSWPSVLYDDLAIISQNLAYFITGTAEYLFESEIVPLWVRMATHVSLRAVGTEKCEKVGEPITLL